MLSGTEAERAAYRRLWGVDPPGDVRVTPAAVGAAVAVRLPLNEQKLNEEWQLARDRVELLMHTAGIPVGSFIYHPYVEALETLILKAWEVLGTSEVFAACLRLIEQMHADPAAAALGYEELKAGLGMGGDYWLTVEVATRQLHYLETNPVWRSLKRRETEAPEPGDAHRADKTPRQTD